MRTEPRKKNHKYVLEATVDDWTTGLPWNGFEKLDCNWCHWDCLHTAEDNGVYKMREHIYQRHMIDPAAAQVQAQGQQMTLFDANGRPL